MKIYGINHGGFGNAVFNKLGTIILHLLFPNLSIESFDTMEEIDKYKETAIKISDESFVEIVHMKIDQGIDLLDPTQSYWLNAYCQYDGIYVRYKSQIIEYILAHPQEKIYTAHDCSFRPIIEILNLQETEKYDVLLHLRLGDFIPNGWVIQPECVRSVFSGHILANLGIDAKIAIVIDHPKTEVEKKYVDYMLEICPGATVYDNNDIITDYNLMRNAKHMICSCSTLTWIAVLFGQENQTVSFPNYEHRWIHEQFRQTHDRFTYYDFSRISETDLHAFFA